MSIHGKTTISFRLLGNDYAKYQDEIYGAF